MAATVATPLETQFAQIAGVAQVLVGGQQKPAIRVRIDPSRLAAMGMKLEDLRGRHRPGHGERAEGRREPGHGSGASQPR